MLGRTSLTILLWSLQSRCLGRCQAQRQEAKPEPSYYKKIKQHRSKLVSYPQEIFRRHRTNTSGRAQMLLIRLPQTSLQVASQMTMASSRQQQLSRGSGRVAGRCRAATRFQSGCKSGILCPMMSS